MSTVLPEDILHLICEELLLRQDFATLFNCSQASKQLAPLSLSCLYRMHSQTRAEEEEAEGLHSGAQQDLLLYKWSVTWRSIILSTMGKTMYPYCNYLRALDLRDLRSLLEEPKFRDKVETKFFGGDLKKFHLQQHYSGLTARGKKVDRTRLDLTNILDAIGDAIVPKAGLLEQLSGEFSSAAFLRWLPHLARLQRLELWDGRTLGDDRVHGTLYSHCPHFNALSIFRWSDSNADTQMGKFISGLQSETLTSFLGISGCNISTETCLALSSHGRRLKELRLGVGPDAVPALVFLKGCTAIQRLHLEFPSTVDLQANHADVLEELLSWLSECQDLEELFLSEARSAPALLTPLLLNDNVKLQELIISAVHGFYNMKDNRQFHQALSNQQQLRTLCLTCDSEDVTRDDIDAVVDSVSQLKELRKLQLRGVSEYFGQDATIRLLSSLPQLEEVYIGGYGASDALLETLAVLDRLKTVSLMAISTFTAQSLLAYISKLGKGNEGLVLAVDNADPDALLTDDEIAQVRYALREKVGGRFEYVPFRDPNVSEFEGESD